MDKIKELIDIDRRLRVIWADAASLENEAWIAIHAAVAANWRAFRAIASDLATDMPSGLRAGDEKWTAPNSTPNSVRSTLTTPAIWT